MSAATSCSKPKPLQSGVRLGEGADREERPGCPPSALATRRRSFPSLAALNDWLGDALPELWAADAARLASWRDCRRLGRRGPVHLMQPSRACVRRLRRIRQARVADVPDSSGPAISYSVAGLLRQSSSQRTSLSPLNASLSPPRDKSSANIAAFLPARTNARSHDHRFRLAAPSGGHSAQAGRTPQRGCCSFAELPPAFRALQQRMLKTPGGDREDGRDSGSRPPA